MRILLYTGKGGVGKTSVAAATAVKSASLGKKTLIISSDTAHSLGDSFDMKLTREPIEVRENLWAQEIDVTYQAEEGWGKIQKYLTKIFTSKAIEDITTQELTIFPGMADLLSLLVIIKHYKEGKYDAIIIDCAPTGETLALLSFPEMMRWWMEKLFPLKKKAIKVLGPLAESILKIPMPSGSVLDEIDNMYYQLSEMKQILSDKDTSSVRIVLNPEKMVIKESQRSYTYLNIYNFNIDAIVVNKVIPTELTDSYFDMWKDIQKKYIADIVDGFSPIPIYYVPLLETEVVGLPILERMGNQIFSSEDPTEIKYIGNAQRIIKSEEGYVLAIDIPFVEKNDLSLNHKGDQLFVKAGPIKRNITLPRTLLDHAVKRAKFEGDVLQIWFGGVENE